jgi:fatty acid desaturase
MYQGTLEEIDIEPAARQRALTDETPRMEIPLPTGEKARARQRRPHRPLPLWLRVVVLLVGWVVLLVGVAGLVLPGIQGILTILLGAAILSVASELAHKWMRQGLKRWPKVWDRVEGFREKIYTRLHRMVDRD